MFATIKLFSRETDLLTNFLRRTTLHYSLLKTFILFALSYKYAVWYKKNKLK